MNSAAQGNGSRDPRDELRHQQRPRSAAATSTTKDHGLLVTPAEHSHTLKHMGKITADKTGEKYDGSSALKWQQLMRAARNELRRAGLLAILEGQAKVMVMGGAQPAQKACSSRSN